MKPARECTDDELHTELIAICHKWDRGEYCQERGGSPGEWIVERIDELETEFRRRKIPIPDVPKASA